MAEQQSPGRALQIYVKQNDGNYKLDAKAASTILNHEDVKDNPIMVVSIAGAMRQGKSFMLNLFLKYLESGKDDNWIADKKSKLKGFSWRGGSERDTLGILMWSEPFIVEGPNTEKVAVLLMDTQGAFDNEHSIAQSTKIFTMSLMMSSYQIYNVMKNLRVDKLGFFQLFLEYSKMTTKETKGKTFQSLLFLIRDWAHRLDHKCGSDGGTLYVQKQLKNFSAGDKNKKDLKESFDAISGFLLPNPGDRVTDEREEGKVFDGAVADISTEFIDHVKELMRQIFAKKEIVKKRFAGEEMTGAKLLTVAQSVSNLLEKGDLPKAKDLVQAQIEAHCNNTVDEFITKFRTLIHEVYNGEPFLDDNFLSDNCENAKQSVMHDLEEKRIYGGDKAKEDCKARLEASLQHEAEGIKASNRNTRNEYWQKYEDYFKTESEKAERQLEKAFKQCVQEQKIETECQRVADELKKKFLEKHFGILKFDAEFEEKIVAFLSKLRGQLIDRNKTELNIAKTSCGAKEGEILNKARTSLIEELKRNICASDKEIDEVLTSIKKQSLEIWKTEITYPNFISGEFTKSLEGKLDEMRANARQLNDENKNNFERDLSLEISRLTKQYVNYMDQVIGKIAREIPELKAFHEDCFQKVLNNLMKSQLKPALKKACSQAIKEKLAEEYSSIEKRNVDNKKEYETHCRIKLTEGSGTARNYIKEKCGKDIKTEVELLKIHAEAKAQAVKTFTTECKNTGPKDLFEKHLRQLQAELDKLLAEAKEANSNNEKVAIIEMADDINAAKKKYKEEMFKCISSDEPLSDDELQEIHQERMGQTMDDFMVNLKDLPLRIQRDCLDKLKAAIQQAFSKVQRENAGKKSEQMQKQNRIIRECMETYDTHMAEASKGHIMSDGELEKCHEEGYQKVMDRLNREKDGMSEKMFQEIEEVLTPRTENRRQDFKRDNEKREEWAQNNMGEYMEKLKLCYEREITDKSEGQACSDEDLQIYHNRAVLATEEKLSKMNIASGEIKEKCQNEIEVASKEWKQEWQKKNVNKLEKFRNDCINLKTKAFDEYKKEMSQDEFSCLIDEKLKSNQKEARRRALEFFDRKSIRGPQEIKEEFESKLKEDIEKEYNEYLVKNKENWDGKQSTATEIVERAKECYHDEMGKKCGLPENDFSAHHKRCKREAEEILAKESATSAIPQSLMDKNKEELDQSIKTKYDEFWKRNNNVLEKHDADIRRYINNDCMNVYEKKMEEICDDIMTPSQLSSSHKKAKDETIRKFNGYGGSFQPGKRQNYLKLLEKLCNESKHQFDSENERKKTKRDQDVESLLDSALQKYNSVMRSEMTGVDSSEVQTIHDRAVAKAKRVISDNNSGDGQAKTKASNDLEGYLRRQHAREYAENINQTRLKEISASTARTVANAYEWYMSQMRSIIRNNCCLTLPSDHAKKKGEAQTRYPAGRDTSNDYARKRDTELDKGFQTIKTEYEALADNRERQYKNLKDHYYEQYTLKASKETKIATDMWFESRRVDYINAKQKEITSNILKEFKGSMPPNNCPQCQKCEGQYAREISQKMTTYYNDNIGMVEKGTGCVIA